MRNYLLDDHDQDMIAKEQRIVRYPDDFVLLFKSKAAAENTAKMFGETPLRCSPPPSCYDVHPLSVNKRILLFKNINLKQPSID